MYTFRMWLAMFDYEQTLVCLLRGRACDAPCHLVIVEYLQEGEHFLGMFSQESAAARACDVAAVKLHGASATTNFPAKYNPAALLRLLCVGAGCRCCIILSLRLLICLSINGFIANIDNSAWQNVHSCIYTAMTCQAWMT